MSDDMDVQIPIMTTRHYVIQTQRMGTISETTGRSASFLQTTSMALVALGLIAPATEFGPVLFAISFFLLLVLVVIGLVTFFAVSNWASRTVAWRSRLTIFSGSISTRRRRCARV